MSQLLCARDHIPHETLHKASMVPSAVHYQEQEQNQHAKIDVKAIEKKITERVYQKLREEYITTPDLSSAVDVAMPVHAANAYDMVNTVQNDQKTFRWTIPVQFFVNTADSGFDNCGKRVPLASFITCREQCADPITIRDIFLLSKLSENGKLQLVDPGQTGAFGNTPQEQYLSYLAPTQLIMNARQREMGVNIGFDCRFFFGDERLVEIICGINIPVKMCEHELDINLVGQNLYQGGAPQNVTLQETTVTNFFADYTDMNSFFVRGVLEPKGLTYERIQRKRGVGDVSLHAMLDVAQYLEWSDVFQVGVSVQFPTAKKAKANTVWDIELGNGGAYGLDVFGSFVFNTKYEKLNPSLYVGAHFQFKHTVCSLRIPTIVRNDSYIQDLTAAQVMEDTTDNDDLEVCLLPGSPAAAETEIPGLIAPVFREYKALAFEECDSTVALFADNIVPVERKYGTQLFVGVGNYTYNLFGSCLRLGVFYDYMRKNHDTFCLSCPQEVCPDEFKKMEECSTQYSHRFSWNLTYRFKDLCSDEAMFELALGSQHIVAGRNIEKSNELVLTAVVTF